MDMQMTGAAREAASAWLRANRARLSEFNARIWSYAEPAWREYKSARAYVDLLRAEGFDGRGRLRRHADGLRGQLGRGPPGVGGLLPNTTPCRATRSRSCPYRGAAGGAASLCRGAYRPAFDARHGGAGAAMLAAKAAMQAHGVKGTLKLFGEPAEKVCGSKPIHAAKGYYDGLDAAVVWHPWPQHRDGGDAIRRLLERRHHLRGRGAGGWVDPVADADRGRACRRALPGAIDACA